MPKGGAVFAIMLFFLNSFALHWQQASSHAIEDFDLQGVALFQCQCSAHACPCQKNGPPSHGICEAADFAYIRSGRYGRVHLDGLTAGSVGNLVDQDTSRLYATIYISREANRAQRGALVTILQFLNGAYQTSPLKASQVQFVPVAFAESVDKTVYTLSIPGVLEERALLHRDASGKPVSTVTAMDAWSNTEHYADNQLFRYHVDSAHQAWDHSGGYANIKYFHLTRKMYDNKEMLGQFGDFSGHWTPEQLAIIHKQSLQE